MNEKYLKISGFLPVSLLTLSEHYYRTIVREHLSDIIRYNIQSDLLRSTESAVTDELIADTNWQMNGRLVINKCDILARSIFTYTKAQVEKTLGLELLDSYVYPGLYLPNSCLPRHIDNNAGEYVATLSLFVENVPDNNWPFTVDGEQIDCRPGDLIIYQGNRYYHERTPLPDNAFSMNLFMLMVDPHGKFKQDANRVKEREEYKTGVLPEFHLRDIL